MLDSVRRAIANVPTSRLQQPAPPAPKPAVAAAPAAARVIAQFQGQSTFEPPRTATAAPQQAAASAPTEDPREQAMALPTDVPPADPVRRDKVDQLAKSVQLASQVTSALEGNALIQDPDKPDVAIARALYNETDGQLLKFEEANHVSNVVTSFEAGYSAASVNYGDDVNQNG